MGRLPCQKLHKTIHLHSEKHHIFNLRDRLDRYRLISQLISLTKIAIAVFLTDFSHFARLSLDSAIMVALRSIYQLDRPTCG
jgi:hypothetical protein